MMVDVIIEDARWRAAGLELLAQSAAQAVIEHLELCTPFAAEFEIGLLACDDARIAVLNTEFREKTAATNVLSWPSQERSVGQGGHPAPPEDCELGDIAIAFETCMREAADQGKDFASHVSHLLVHGVLHLLGYDHIEDTDAVLMEGLEVEILGKLGISNPYDT